MGIRSFVGVLLLLIGGLPSSALLLNAFVQKSHACPGLPENPRSIGRMAEEHRLEPRVLHWVHPQEAIHGHGHEIVLGDEYFHADTPVAAWHGQMVDYLPDSHGDLKPVWLEYVRLVHTPQAATVPPGLYAAAGLKERAPGLYYFKVSPGGSVQELVLRDVPLCKQYLRVAVQEHGAAHAELVRAHIESYHVNTFAPNGVLQTVTTYSNPGPKAAERPGYTVTKMEYGSSGDASAPFPGAVLKSRTEYRVTDPSDPWWPDILQE